MRRLRGDLFSDRNEKNQHLSLPTKYQVTKFKATQHYCCTGSYRISLHVIMDTFSIAKRYLNMMNVIPPNEFNAEFKEKSFLLITSSGVSTFQTHQKHANRILINLFDNEPKAVFKQNGLIVQIQAIYGFPNPDVGWTKYSIANALGLGHAKQCKMVQINKDSALLYFGTCVFQDQAYLYIDVTVNISTMEVRIIEKMRLTDTRRLGLDYDDDKIPSRVPVETITVEFDTFMSHCNAAKLSQKFKIVQ